MRLTFGHVFLSRLYGLAWTLVSPLLKRNSRLADGWSRRLVPDDWARLADVWIQAASGGEAYLAADLVSALAPLPDGGIRRVLVTTWTRQGLEVLHGLAVRLRESRPDLEMQVTLFPLDHPERMAKAVRMAHPRLVVLLETELWPGLLFACARFSVPVAVVNGRLTEKSLRGYRWLGRLASGFWQAVAPVEVGAVSEADAARFGELFGMRVGDSRLGVIPNIKFDRAVGPAEADASRLAPLLPPMDEYPVLLLASVRKEEETLLLPVIRALRERRPEATIIVAPRHMHRVEPWNARLSGAGFSVVRRTWISQEHPAEPGKIVLWDAFGELASLYALARHVFVGGSLAKLGGQNPLEALACGRIPCVGPHTANFDWALRSSGGNDLVGLVELGLVHECADAASLVAAMTDDSADTPPENVRREYSAWLRARQGGLQKSVAFVEKWLQPA